jgi:putative membrane-bound dehydrogenase-like protein
LKTRTETGKFDTSKLFYEGFNNISGIEIGFGGVFVASNPNFYFVPDKDGDDKPDGAPRYYSTAGDIRTCTKSFNSFNWGPDGWLYGCQGIFTQSKVGKPGARDEERIPFNAGVWRWHPTRKQFEVFAHGTSNPWVWTSMIMDRRSSRHVSFRIYTMSCREVSTSGRQGKHFNPYAYDDIKTIARHRHFAGGDWASGSRMGDNTTDNAGGGHAHAGALVYLGTSWPAHIATRFS